MAKENAPEIPGAFLSLDFLLSLSWTSAAEPGLPQTYFCGLGAAAGFGVVVPPVAGRAAGAVAAPPLTG